MLAACGGGGGTTNTLNISNPSLSVNETPYSFYNYFGNKVITEIPYKRMWTDVSDNQFSEDPMIEIKAVGDFNKDGKDDIVVTYQDNMMPPLIMISLGDGKFSQSMPIEGNASRRHFGKIEVTDINNDGYLDLIGYVSPHENLKVAAWWDLDEPNLILINQNGKSFKTLELGFESNNTGASGDLDKDGLKDLIFVSNVAKRPTDKRLVLKQNNNGHFDIVGKFPTQFDNLYIVKATIADFNNDGFQDILLTGADMALEDGQFYIPPKPSDSIRNGYFILGLGNGTLDLNSYAWSRFGSHWMTDEQFAIYQSKVAGLSSRPYPSIGPTHSEAVDFNKDGLLDLIIVYYVQFGVHKTSGFKIYINKGNGKFEDQTQELSPNQEVNRNLESPVHWTKSISFPDLDNNGEKDILLYTDRNASGFLKTKNGFQLVESLPNNEMVSCDVNGDGKTDLVTIEIVDKVARVVSYLNK